MGAQIEQRPENFRTLGALHRTMGHLRAIMDARGTPLVNVHKFLWDRYRGVRQDLFVQGFEARPSGSLTRLLLRAMFLRQPQERCPAVRTWHCGRSASQGSACCGR